MPESIQLYLKAIRKIPLLKREEEIDLTTKAREGDQDARDKVIRSNLRLVINLAKRYVNLGVPLIDLIEEGNIGLMKSVEKFDPTRGFRFSTYASWWIKQGISRAVIEQGKLIRMPVYINEEIYKYKKAFEKLSQKLKRKPQLKEVAKILKVSVKRLRELDQYVLKISSLDSPIGTESDGTLKDLMEDENIATPDVRLDSFFDRERAKAFLEGLNERERKVIDMRFGLNDGNAQTLAEIARTMGISRERVRQIEDFTLRKIRSVLTREEEIKRSDFDSPKSEGGKNDSKKE